MTDLEDRLGAARFAECAATQMLSAGWIEPRGRQHGALVESVGGQWVLKLCVERKAVPGPVVKGELAQRLDRIEQETGRRPKGKRAKEVREEIVHELLPRAFPRRSTLLLWIDPQAGCVVIDSGSAKKAEEAMTLLVEALGGEVVLQPLDTELAPATAMAQWLQDREAPAGFTLDRDCVLQQPDSEKAAVR
jgi:recombination associated protein RdgC